MIMDSKKREKKNHEREVNWQLYKTYAYVQLSEGSQGSLRLVIYFFKLYICIV